MEQAVWLAFGAIALIIGLGIIMQVISSNSEESRFVEFRESMDQLQQQCDFVCDGTIDTYLSTDVDLSSGLMLYAAGRRLCGNLNISEAHSNETYCVMCSCDVTMREPFNLQTELARKSFKKHKYSCYFLRKENEVDMECKG